MHWETEEGDGMILPTSTDELVTFTETFQHQRFRTLPLSK